MTDQELYDLYELERNPGETLDEYMGRIMYGATMPEQEANEILKRNGLVEYTDGLYLITPDMYRRLPVWFMLTSIFNKTVFVEVDDIDLDTRSGMIAYGVKHLEDKLSLIKHLGLGIHNEPTN